MEKLVMNFRKQLEIWLAKKDKVENKELYRFLHSIVGTAKTIGLVEAGQKAESLMVMLNETDDRRWANEELQAFLLPLISIFFYQESFSEEDVIERKEEDEGKELILLVDDDTTLLMDLKDQLESNGWIVFALANPDRALQYYYDLHPDCVILDFQMKDQKGLEVLVELKKNLKQQFIPTIMMSRNDTKEARIKSYQLGADDFIPKPFDSDEFIVRINRQLDRKQAIDELILVDELTKVNNRKYLSQAYERLVSNLKRKNEPFCMAILDLDHFKQVNKNNGHAVGDIVLSSFASFLRNKLRLNDTIIRYGGEEFIVLFPETKQQEAKTVLERILKEFSELPFGNSKGTEPFSCTFSAGVYEVQGAELDLKTNFNLVDGALLEAKLEGRNRVKIAPNNHERAHQRVVHVGIVDDDPIIRTMLEDLISKSNITEGLSIDIHTFRDGMEFLESDWYMEEKEPYLIILDGMMPRMDGLEVLQKLRGLKYQERFTVMMLTSRKSDQDIARALSLGADDYITKPFKLLELETRLSHLIKRMK